MSPHLSVMLNEVLAAFTFRFAELAGAERASLFLVDWEQQEIRLAVAREEGGRPVDFRFPLARGIAGRVATRGLPLRVDDAYAEPLFNPDVDRETGFRTRSILCVPVADRSGRVFAVAELLNKRGGEPFTADDERRFTEFTRSIGPVLESWVRMGLAARPPRRDGS